MDPKGKQAKLKSPAELQELLDVTRYIGCHAPSFCVLSSCRILPHALPNIDEVERVT